MASLDVPKNPWKLWIFSPRQYSCTPWCLIFFFFDLGSRRKTCRWKVRLSAMIWSYWNHECDVQWMYDVSLSVAELFVCGGDISNSNFINFVTRWQDSWFYSQFTILSQFYDAINGICGLKTPRKDRSFFFPGRLVRKARISSSQFSSARNRHWQWHRVTGSFSGWEKLCGHFGCWSCRCFETYGIWKACPLKGTVCKRIQDRLNHPWKTQRAIFLRQMDCWFFGVSKIISEIDVTVTAGSFLPAVLHHRPVQFEVRVIPYFRPWREKSPLTWTFRRSQLECALANWHFLGPKN